MNEFNPMDVADVASQLAESYGGMRAALIGQGFTPEQAGDLVVATMQRVTAEEWSKALGRKDS